MRERGNSLARKLDYWAGIPLVHCLGFVRRKNAFHETQPRTIGVLCLGAIGDALLLSGLLDGLRRQCPTSHITFITSKANAGVAPLLPSVDSHISFPIKEIYQFVRYMRSQRFDVLLDSTQWARVGEIITALSGARLTIGFHTPGQHHGYVYDYTTLHRNDVHEVDNFLALGRTVWPQLNGHPHLLAPKHCPPAFAAKLSALPPLAGEEPFVALHLLSSGLCRELKHWPEEYWGELARHLLEKGFHVLLSGSPTDAPDILDFQRRWLSGDEGHRVHNVAGKTNLATLGWLFQQAKAVVSVNTGVMHLAALCGAPTVGLHGPSSPLRWGPVGERVAALVPERGDFGYHHLGFEERPNAQPALPFLSVESVLEALRGFGLKV